MAVDLAERLRQNVAGHPVHFGGSAIPVTLSLGVAASSGDRNQPGQLLRYADEALYTAKKGGRNRVESFQSAQAAEQPVR